MASYGTTRSVADVFGNATELYAVVNDNSGANTDIVRKNPSAWQSLYTGSTKLWGGTLSTTGDIVTVGSRPVFCRQNPSVQTCR